MHKICVLMDYILNVDWTEHNNKSLYKTMCIIEALSYMLSARVKYDSYHQINKSNLFKVLTIFAMVNVINHIKYADSPKKWAAKNMIVSRRILWQIKMIYGPINPSYHTIRNEICVWHEIIVMDLTCGLKISCITCL